MFALLYPWKTLSSRHSLIKYLNIYKRQDNYRSQTAKLENHIWPFLIPKNDLWMVSERIKYCVQVWLSGDIDNCVTYDESNTEVYRSRLCASCKQAILCIYIRRSWLGFLYSIYWRESTNHIILHVSRWDEHSWIFFAHAFLITLLYTSLSFLSNLCLT